MIDITLLSSSNFPSLMVQMKSLDLANMHRIS